MEDNKVLTRSIIKTLCYAQIFSYPLTVSEVWQYLISPKKIPKEVLLSHLSENGSLFEQIQKYIVLKGDAYLVSERQKRTCTSHAKIAKAQWIAHVLSYIPTIKLIGISGSLSMGNAKKEDDIDLFFITSKNTLWTTRFLVSMVLLLLHEKRGRGEKYAQDKICPNMFLSEDVLELPNKNIYIAHEIAQMKVLVSKNDTHRKFLSRNKWVLRYMPHAFRLDRKKRTEKDKSFFLRSYILASFEKLFYLAQHVYMHKRITNEKIGKHIAAFHPLPHKEAITELYVLKTAYHLRAVDTKKKRKTASYFSQIN